MLYHGDAVEDIGVGHGALVVGYDDELATAGKLSDDVVELVYVAVVERGVYFVKNAEGGGFYEVDGEEERNGCERFFPTGELVYAEGALAFRAGHDVDGAFQRAGGVGQHQIAGVFFGKEGFEDRVEVFSYGGEGGHKGFVGLGFYFGYGFF